jgi:hypothetical protein
MAARLLKKFKYFVICFCILIFFSLIVTMLFLLPKLLYPHTPLSHRVASNCFTVKKALELYYAKINENIPENLTADFVNFLVDVDPSFSAQAPIPPYTSEGDMSFYLFLPPRLESPSPLLIWYTSPFTAGRKQNLRAVIFLRGDEMDMVMLREEVLEAIIGKETLKKKKPDFYIWKKRSQYLDQTSHKEKYRTNENKT